MIVRYLAKEIKRKHIQTVLGVKRRRFCELVKKYRDSPESFSAYLTLPNIIIYVFIIDSF